MQPEINRIITLLEELASGNNWTGVNTLQVLDGITAEQAVKRLNNKHLNIAELTAHLTCWNHVITQRLNAVNAIPAKEEDFPVIDYLTEEAWQDRQKLLHASFQVLIDQLKTKEDDILSKPMFEGATSAYRNIHGQISHLHYHIGQIAMLKKICE